MSALETISDEGIDERIDERETEAISSDRAHKSAPSFSTAQLRRDLSINDADLDGAMTEQAGLYGHYSSLYAKAQLQCDHAKIQVDVARAKCYRIHRNRILSKGGKPTEPQIDAEISCDPSYIKAQEKHSSYKMKAELAKQSLEALKQRKDMLIQKGVARREEMKGEIFIKSKESESEELRSRAKQIVRDGRDKK